MPKANGVEVVTGIHSTKWTPGELIYPVGEQELIASHKSMRYFDNIVLRCGVLDNENGLFNNTLNEPGRQNISTCYKSNDRVG